MTIDQQSNANKGALSRSTNQKALPQSGVETLIKILKGYAVSSRWGESEVSYKDVSSATGLNASMVSRNNAFLTESGLIESPKYGYYIPTESTVLYARAAAWDEASATRHLADALARSWYGQVVIQNFAIRSSLTRDDLRRVLGIKSGASEGDSANINQLIDLLIYSGLIVQDESGKFTKGTAQETQESSGVVLQGSDSVGSYSTSIHYNYPDKEKPDNPFTIRVNLNISIANWDELNEDNAIRLRNWLHRLQDNAASASPSARRISDQSEVNNTSELGSQSNQESGN